MHDPEADLATLRQLLISDIRRPPFDEIRSRRRRRTSRLGVVAVAIAVVCVVVGAAVGLKGGASSAPIVNPPTVAVSGLAELAHWQQGPARIQVVDPDTAILQADGSPDFAAYDLATGARRWSRTLPSANLAEFYAAGTTVVLEAKKDLGQAAGYSGFDTVAVDRLTGEARWHADTYTKGVGGMVVSFLGETMSATATVHDPDTYRTLWSTPGVSMVSVAGNGEALWMATIDGTLTEHDPRTGAARRSVTFAAQNPSAIGVRLVGGLLGVTVLAAKPDGTDSAHSFWFDPATLTPFVADGSWTERSDCGVVWCGNGGPNGGGTYLLDKTTGATIRHIDDFFMRVGTPAGVLRIGTGGDRMGTETFALIDPMTDEVRLDLSGWRLVVDSGPYTLGLALLPQGAGPRPFLVRPSQDGAGTELAVLDPGGPHLLGRLPAGLQTCSVAPEAIACTTAGGEISIWHVPG